MGQTTKKVKIIPLGRGLSLDSLDLNPGDFIGFKTNYRVCPWSVPNFILGEVSEKGLIRIERAEHYENHGGITIADVSEKGSALLYFLGLNEKPFCFHRPEGFSISLPIITQGLKTNLRSLQIIDGGTVDYAIGKKSSVFVGESNILNALREMEGFELYANLLEFSFDAGRKGR